MYKHRNQIYPSQSIPYPLIVHGATPVYDVLSFSKQVKREKIERPSPEGQPKVFSKSQDYFMMQRTSSIPSHSISSCSNGT